MQQQNNNTYNQPPQGPMAAPQMIPPPVPRSMGRQARWAQWLTEQQVVWKSLPKWLSVYSVIAYVLALTMVTVMYTNYSLPWYYMLSGMVAVLVFFLYGSHLTNDKLSIDKIHKSQTFEKRIFIIAFIPRLLYTLLIYWIFQSYYGDAFGFDNADAMNYDEAGQHLAAMIEKGNFHFYDELSEVFFVKDISDMGYSIYIGFIYWLTGNSIIFVRLLKCLWSAFTVVLLYRLAKRNFGDQTARIAAIFCALWPNFWYYCGCHLKEVEMVFLTVLFVEQADQMLRSRKFTAWKVLPIMLIVAVMFTLRTPLALVAILALLFTIIMSSTRVVSWNKRIFIGLIAVALIGVTMGNKIQEEGRHLVESVQGGYQKTNMEWRAVRKDTSGNQQKFAKYAGAAVFAPMIFTLPFPTMVRPFDGQNVQQLLNGGNFTKNILSFFIILGLTILLLSGNWRSHLLPLSFMLGYVVVLTMSAFAQSERFHQPVMPFELMFVAYGISIAATMPKYKRWFTYWCVVMFVGALAWNWFKLAGRGLV